jgi:pilus assembly protein Flp/PilA
MRPQIQPPPFRSVFTLCLRIEGIVALEWQIWSRRVIAARGGDAMLRLINSIRKLLADREGVTLMEYCLIAALIAIVSLVILTAIGTEVSNIFSKINSALSSGAS